MRSAFIDKSLLGVTVPRTLKLRYILLIVGLAVGVPSGYFCEQAHYNGLWLLGLLAGGVALAGSFLTFVDPVLPSLSYPPPDDDTSDDTTPPEA